MTLTNSQSPVNTTSGKDRPSHNIAQYALPDMCVGLMHNPKHSNSSLPGLIHKVAIHFVVRGCEIRDWTLLVGWECGDGTLVHMESPNLLVLLKHMRIWISISITYPRLRVISQELGG